MEDKAEEMAAEEAKMREIEGESRDDNVDQEVTYPGDEEV